MKKEINLTINLANQKLTLWKILKKDYTYVMFNASIQNSRKKEDDTWDNVNTYCTCFVKQEDIIKKLINGFTEKRQIKIIGTMSFKRDLRDQINEKGISYKQDLFHSPVINILNFDFIENNQNTKYNNPSLQEIDDDIPF